jgi:hypothetical protein
MGHKIRVGRCIHPNGESAGWDGHVKRDFELGGAESYRFCFSLLSIPIPESSAACKNDKVAFALSFCFFRANHASTDAALNAKGTI